MGSAPETAGAVDGRAGASPAYIVCSPRPATGKTLLARLVVGFSLAEGRAVRGFDLNPDEPQLTQLAPAAAVCIDIRDPKHQVELFDTLIGDAAAAKVVDVGHAAFKTFFDVAEQIAFFQEARHYAIEPVILFACDLHASSPRAYIALEERFPRAVLVPVQNEAIIRTARFRELYPTHRTTALPLRLQTLSPAALEAMQRADCSFAGAHRDLPTDIPWPLRQELRKWTSRAFLELRELELRLLLEKLRTSLWGIA